MVNGILIGINALIVFIIAAVNQLKSRPHRHVILETTFATEHLNEPVVLRLAHQYRLRIWQICILISVLGLGFIFISFDSLVLFYWCILIFLDFGLTYGLTVYSIRQMGMLKREKNWMLPTTTQRSVDTKLIVNKNRRLITQWWFLGSALILILGIFSSWRTLGWQDSWPFILIGGLSWGLFRFLYQVVANLTVRQVTKNAQYNQLLNDTYRQTWSRQMVISSYVFAMLPLIVASLNLWVGFGALYLILVVMTTGYLIYDLLRQRRFEDQILLNLTEQLEQDADRYWRYDIYANPHDKRLFVPDRVGTNISLNVSRPVGKMLVGGIIVFVLAILAVISSQLVVLDFDENSIQAQVKAQQVILKAPGTQTSKIKRQKIKSVTLLENFPNHVVRTKGLGTSKFSIGHFRVRQRAAKFYVANQSHAFLRIKTAQRDYYFAAKNTNQTRDIYKQLK